MTNQSRAYLYAGITIFFWSTVATAFKIGLQHIDTIQMLFLATLTSFIILFSVATLQGKLHLFFRQKRADFLRSALLGFLNPFLYYLVLFKAYSILPAQVAQPLNMIWPIVLVFLSVPLLHQKIAPGSFLALFISFSGVYLISSRGNITPNGIDDPAGVMLAIGSAFIWAFFWILTVRDRREEIIQLLTNFFFACLFITVMILTVSGLRTISPTGMAMGIYSGVFEMGFGFVFWLKALKLSGTTDKISNLIYLAPFISLIFIRIFVGETIYITTPLGLILIIAGIITGKIR